MNDDPLMRALAEQAKQEAAEDAALPPELARPLDANELDAILRGTTAALETSGGRVVPIGKARRSWGLLASIVVPLASAAAIVLFVARSTNGGASLPTYDLVVEGGERATRSASDAVQAGPVRVARDGHLVLVLRPRVPGSAEAQARVMIDRDGSLTRWETDARASEEGAIRIDARGAALAALPSGASDLVVFVADAAHLPGDEASARRAQRGETPGVQVLVQSIAVAP